MGRDSIFGNGALAALVLVVAMAFYWTKHNWGPTANTIRIPIEESYEMGRAESAPTNDYDLSGRKVVHTINDPNSVAVTAQNPNAVPATAVSNAVAGATPAKSASQAAADAKKIADAKKKAQMSVSVVDSSYERMRGFADSQKTQQQAAQYTYQQNGQNQAPKANAADETPEKPKMTAAQWRAVLFANPSPGSVQNFMKAYRDGEIKSQEFYEIADALLKDTAADRQGAGLLAYTLDTSVTSFTKLSGLYQDSNTPEAMKTKIFAVLRSYGEASKLATLSRIFYLNDTASLAVAVKVLEQALAAQKPSNNPQNDRAGRGPVSVTIPVSTFNMFIAPLNRLVTNSEAGLGSQAQALIDSIKSLSNA